VAKAHHMISLKIWKKLMAWLAYNFLKKDLHLISLKFWGKAGNMISL
jgi:hypothetical protein